MSKKTLRELAELVGEDVDVEIESIQHREAYSYLPELKVAGNGSIKVLQVAAYSSEAKDDQLLHKIFSKVRENPDQKLKSSEKVSER